MVKHHSYENLSKVCYLAPGTDKTAYGLHDRRAFHLAELTRKEGIPAEVISVRDPDFLKKIVKISQIPGHAIDSGYAGYASWVIIDRVQSANLFDLLDTNMFALLGDHLFYDQMWQKLQKMGSKTVYYSGDETIVKDELPYLSSVKNPFSFFLDFEPTYQVIEANSMKQLKDREIDLLIPWTLNPNHADIDFVLSELSKMGGDVVEIGQLLIEQWKTEYKKSMLPAFFDIYSSIKGTPFQFNRDKTKEDYMWLSMLHLVDFYIRHWRRYTILAELANSSLPLNIVITQDEKKSVFCKQKFSCAKQIKWIGPASTQQLDELYRNSKMVLNCNPTYPNGIHERVTHAMSRGCCVISDKTPGLMKNFKNRDHILYMESYKDIPDLLRSDINYLQTIANNGRNIVEERFTIEQYCKIFLTQLNQYSGRIS